MKVQGAKAGSGSTRQAVVASDSAQSKTYIKYLLGLCEGEVEGLANGLQSIFLSDTPLQDSKGNDNYKNVTADFRPGTNDQTYIEGFPETSNDIEAGVELKTNPWIRSITNLDINAVRVRLRWGALRTTNASNGDVTGVTIQYAIDISTDGGPYVEMLNTQVSDKTSSNYERAHRIDLPKSTSGWNVRVRRITPPANSDYVTDQMYVASYAEVIDAKFRYPNTALLGLQYDAQNFSSVAQVSAEVKGLKIRVPSNYDPVKRTYTGIWDGSFQRVYSNNPAWIYFDLCTAKRYGLGERITDQMLDKASLYRLGQYCDEMVSDGQGGLEPRFTCNVYIQSAEDAYSILSKLAGVFRAISYWDGDAIICDADIPQDVFFNYTNANVIDGKFEYSGTRARDRHTVAKVAWSNPDNRYKTEYEVIRDENAIAKNGINSVDIEAWGCTSRAQAQRAGHWALKSEQLETQTVNFKVGLDGHIPVPGKVIAVADNDYAGRFIGGRIKAIANDWRVLTLDRQVTALAGDTIQINSEKGQSVKAVIASVNGAQVTLRQAVDQGTIAAQNVWSIDSSILATRKFRVLTVKQDEEHQFSISALEYNADKYDAIDNGAYVDTTAPVSIVNPNTQAAVQNVQVSSYDQVQQGINVATMVIAWDKADYAVKYLVEWKKDDGSWIKMPLTGNTSVEVPGVYAGNYMARITAYSAFDAASLATTSILTAISGKQGKPPKLAYLQATGTMFGMKLNWGFPNVGALDTAYTEIQYSSTSNGANVQSLGSYAYPTTSTQQQGLSGNLTLWYRARLIDRIGNTGDWSDWVSGTSTAQTADILNALSGQITDSQLDKDLKAKIDKIDTVAGLNGDVGNIINKVNEVQQTADSALSKAQQEAQDRATAISNVQSSIDQEAKDRVSAVQNLQTAVSKEVSDRITAISSLNDGMTQETNARKDADQSIVNTVNTNKASTDQSIAAVQSAVNVVSTAQSATATKLDGVYARVVPITADSTSLTADSTSNTASSWSIQSAVVDADNALGQRIDVVTANVANNSALIQSEQIARVNADTALATRIDTLTTTVNGNTALVTAEAKARSDADSALTQQVNSAQSTADNAKSLITTEANTRASADSALSSRIDSMSVNVDANKSLIQSEQNVRASADSALGQRIDTIATSTSDNASAIQQEAKARSDANTTLTQQINTAQSTADNANSLITSESNTRASADNALSQRIDTISAKADGNASAIVQEQTTRADADSANAKALSDYKSQNDSAVAGATQSINTLTTQQKAQSEKLDGVYAKVTPLTADSTTLTADSTSNQASSWSIQSAQADADSALGQRIDVTQASVANNAALIQSEQTARVNADSALSQQITTLQAQVGSNTSSIQQEAKARSDADTAQSTLINTVQSATANAQSTANDALNKANAANSNIATVQTKVDTVTSAQNATANQVNTIQTTVGNNTASIQAQQTSIDGLTARASLKLESGNVIGGVSVENNSKTVDAIWRANTFAIAPPATADDQTPAYAFVYQSTSTTLANGTVVPKGLYLDSAYISQIDASKINVDSLSAISANLGSIKVGSANIADLSVDTLKIKDRAITSPFSAVMTDNYSFNSQGANNSSANYDQTFTYDLYGLSNINVGSYVTIFFRAECKAVLDFGSGSSYMSSDNIPENFLADILINDQLVMTYTSESEGYLASVVNNDGTSLVSQTKFVLSLRNMQMSGTQLNNVNEKGALKVRIYRKDTNRGGSLTCFMKRVEVNVTEFKK
ncbi:hypothetical protein P256_00077 [Acinetobacter nectaris CIP 110549]|uniref:Fibronectin type-III domain-containing protein n=1 Tax=Acinetobacter nectaris CIP 110549 TaxID=1392540 RepID=V2TU72_9GAMM|nr:phage tail protein [Acinetobacter nectaris]ESK41092.1 hypothetical protein P256_00077 [Acinetobacter nectaris CIP 110549]